MENNNELLRLRAIYFKDNNIPVHIVKKNGFFNNGIITEIDSNFIMLIDEKVGETPVFYLEIDEIKKRENKR